MSKKKIFMAAITVILSAICVMAIVASVVIANKKDKKDTLYIAENFNGNL